MTPGEISVLIHRELGVFDGLLRVRLRWAFERAPRALTNRDYPSYADARPKAIRGKESSCLGSTLPAG